MNGRPRRIDYQKDVPGEGILVRSIRRACVEWIEEESSLNSLAKEAGVAQPTLHKWLVQKSKSISAESLDKLAEVLHDHKYLDVSSLTQTRSQIKRRSRADGSVRGG